MKFPHRPLRQRAPLVSDGKGNTIRDWANATLVPFAANIQPERSAEQTRNQDRITSRWWIAAEPSADVVATDRVVHVGLTLQVDGEIQPWPDRNGVTDHLEGYLKRVVG